METVNFYPKIFTEIPDQDNPAFCGDECLMVVRENVAYYESDRPVVLHIKPDQTESVNHVAVFWNERQAERFCDMIDFDFLRD